MIYQEDIFMENTIKKIGILTSGGDAPGMSTAARAVALYAINMGLEVAIIYEGYKGLVYDNIKEIKSVDVLDFINKGGTAIYSDRCKEFETEEGMKKGVETCKKHNIDAIIAIGGDGTFGGATDLSHLGIPTIGIPATIDNDVTSSDYALGFDTALNTNLMLGDRLRDTCESHARCNVIEIMGRNAGYLALQSGIALGATVIAIPECPFDEDAAMAKLKAARAAGQRSFIIAIAEGFPEKEISRNDPILKVLSLPCDEFEVDENKNKIKLPLSCCNIDKPLKIPYGEYLAAKINLETKEEGAWIDTKFCRPAHMVRGGAPSAKDRLMAAQFAEKAVKLILEGKSDLVVCLRNGEIGTADIAYALVLDKMYKGKNPKKWHLDKITPEQLEEMKEFCAMRKKELDDMYALAELISH